MAKKTDLRIIKTKRNLYEGLAQLLAEKPYESIKIKDICDKSLVNRSTFYDHYSSKTELLTAMIEERQKELKETTNIKNINRENYKETFLNYIKNTLIFIDKSKEINKNILLNDNNIVVKNILFRILIKDISTSIDKIKKTDTPTELLARFYVAGFVELLCLYLEKPNYYSKERILNYAKNMIETHKF